MKTIPCQNKNITAAINSRLKTVALGPNSFSLNLVNTGSNDTSNTAINNKNKSRNTGFKVTLS
jgi:hypothetical protein